MEDEGEYRAKYLVSVSNLLAEKRRLKANKGDREFWRSREENKVRLLSR